MALWGLRASMQPKGYANSDQPAPLGAWRRAVAAAVETAEVADTLESAGDRHFGDRHLGLQ